jgi:Tfp pilus assembly protein PilW
MKPPGRAAVRRRRAGTTVTEMVVATALGTMLMMLVATTWTTFGRPALEVESRARIEQEGILAAQSLACDFAGFLADTPGRTGTMSVGAQNPYQFVGWDASNPGVLLLNFYGASTSAVITISYQLEGNLLVRTNSSTGVSTTVARYVTGFSAAPVSNNVNQVVITLTITYRNFTSTFTLVGVSPS